MLAARDAGLHMPDGGMPLSTWTDLADTGETMETRREVDPVVGDDGVHDMASHYLAGGDLKDPLASPFYADLSGLPPLLMQVSDAEVLLADTTRVVEKARAAGVDVTEEICPRCSTSSSTSAKPSPKHSRPSIASASSPNRT